MNNETRDIQLIDIKVGPRRDEPKPASIKALAESIVEIGLLHPIGVTENLRLIYGRTRMLAFQRLGRHTIPAIIHKMDDLHAELAEIDENIQRRVLNALQEAKALKRRKEIYEALHPETKKPGRGKNQHTPSDKMSLGTEIPTFTDDTSTKTGKSRRTVERAVEIGENLTDAAAEKIADSPIAKNRGELKKLADLTPEKQVKAAEKIASGKAKTVDQATGKKPAPKDTNHLGRIHAAIREAVAVLGFYAVSFSVKDFLDKLEGEQ